MIKRIRYSHLLLISFAVVFCVIFFAGGAQSAFAAESVPVQVLAYENGDLDHTEVVWEGTYTPPAKSVPITEVADAFASKAPEGYSFGIASIKKAQVDTSIYQVEEIDGSAGIYRLADYTTYDISGDDILGLYFYKAAVEVPVYWCQYNIDGALIELTDREYRAVSGSETRVKSITVPDDRAASLGPVESADLVIAMRNAEETGVDTYVVGQDGLLGSPLFDTPYEASSEEGEDHKVVYKMGGESTADSAYKIDSDGLLLENTSSGVAFAGVSMGGLKTETQGIDTSNPVVSPVEYEMIAGSLPAVYIVYENPSSTVPLASGIADDGSGAIPWLIVIAIATLIVILILVILILFLRKRKRA